MPSASPPPYLRIHAAYQRGDHATVLREGDAVAAELAASAALAEHAADVSCMLGTIHLSAERFAVAASYLEQGLGQPGQRSESALRPFDFYELALLDCYHRIGRYEDAWQRLGPLLEPQRSIDTRFGATRAQALINAVRGDVEAAHFILNTATGLALRMRSKFRAALIDGDRAIVLAGHGRLYEGVTAADRVLPLFVRPAVGELQRWGNAAAAAIALTIARLAANADDVLTAQRLLIPAATAVERAGSAFLDAHQLLSQGSFATAEGNFDEAEMALIGAQRAFATLGTAPASALTTLEQGRLARVRGLHLSAVPLCERALAEFRELGQPREANEARQIILSLQAATTPAPR